MYSPPCRLENCKKMVLPNPGKWSIQGHSKAGERTGFWLEPLNIVLDAGLSTYKTPKCIFLTHSHTDHSDHIPNIFGTTTKPGKNQEGLIGRPLVMSPECVPLIKKQLESIVDRSKGVVNYCQKLEEQLNYDKGDPNNEDDKNKG